MARRPSPPEGHDPSRREFFRTFSRQTIQNAGAVAGAAAELRRTSLAVARDLLDVNQTPVPGTTQTIIVPAETPPPTNSTFRSAYRFSADVLVVLDQRELPARTVTFETREPTEIASAMRAGAITAGPVLAEVAAYGLVAAAARGGRSTERQPRADAAGCAGHAARSAARRPRADSWRSTGWRRATTSWPTPMPTIRPCATAWARRQTRSPPRPPSITRPSASVGAAQLAGLRSDSDDDRRPLQVLIFGDSGPLTCGLVGMASAMFQALSAEGRQSARLGAGRGAVAGRHRASRRCS